MSPPARPLRSVWFDCDSTLSACEGIDELAALRDDATRAAVERATAAAMDGSLPLEAVYAARLAAIRPTCAECAAVAAIYRERAVADAADVIAALTWLGKAVGVISGGLTPPVREFALGLGVAEARILAVDVRFDAAGGFAGHDATSPLARAGGKPELLAARPAAERPLGFVGDGITDLEAAPVIERFCGFGGVVRRAAVAARAECYADGPGLATTLPFLLVPAELDRLAAEPRFRRLVRDAAS